MDRSRDPGDEAGEKPGYVPADMDQILSDADTFAAAYGESIDDVLDLSTWEAPENLNEVYARAEQEIAEAVRFEDSMAPAARRDLFPKLKTRLGAPPEAGVYSVSTKQLERVHRQVLLNGAAEACDGTQVEHDTLPLTITQLGVVLVSYHGAQQSFAHRLFRRDLRLRTNDPLEDVMALLDSRDQRGGLEMEDRESLSRLARRGVMAYAERAVLADRSTAPWRIGHGNPAPYELLTGSENMRLLQASLDALRRLLLEHKKFLFVPSAPAQRGLLTLGNALRPLEYCIIGTAERNMLQIVERGHYSQSAGREAREFCQEVGPLVYIGLYRASHSTPAFLFYAHADHCHEAALLALADSILQEHRGFPMLIDLADALCRVNFGTDLFRSLVQTAYASAGAPYRFLPERQTRK